MSEPIENGGKTGGEIQLTESKIEAQLLQRGGGVPFVWSEIQNKLGSIVVTGDGDAVAGRKAVEESMNRLEVTTLDEIYGWTGFDEEQDLGGFVDAEEIREGLLDAVIEKMKVFTGKTADKLPARVSDEDSDVDAVHGDADVGRRLGGLLGKSGWRKEETPSCK
jgi:hypothetical protein